MTPIVTIGMPSYNCRHTIAYSIASILNQTFEDWELIVYDDGSTDGTVLTARRFRDPRIRIIETGRNRGLGSSLNSIVADCKTKFFARMDADDIAYSGRLQEQVKYFEAHPDVDLLGGSMMVFRSGGEALGLRRADETHEQICAHPMTGISMAHPTWMGRTAWFRRNPYRADAIRMEDWELLLRTYRTSKFANVSRAVLGYREDSLSITKIFAARRNICRTVLAYAGDNSAPRAGLKSVMGQLARFTLDVTAVGTGLNHRLLRHRVPPFTTTDLVQWLEVYESTRARVVREIGNPQRS